MQMYGTTGLTELAEFGEMLLWQDGVQELNSYAVPTRFGQPIQACVAPLPATVGDEGL